MKNLKSGPLLATMALLDIVFVWVGMYASIECKHKGWLSVAVAAVAIVTFFGLLQLGRGQSGEEFAPERLMRRAIAAAAVVAYFVLVSIVAFFPLGTEQNLTNPVTSMLLTNFTTVVGLIVAFYFGSSAYVEARKK